MAEPFTTYKLIVLYMAKHAKGNTDKFSDFRIILDREYTDYFQLQKVLSELTETELLPESYNLQQLLLTNMTEEGVEDTCII